jgi:hypothetical protein
MLAAVRLLDGVAAIRRSYHPSFKPAYVANCFWLMLPPMAISGLLGGDLPAVFQAETFWQDIPVWISWTENLSRILLIGLTVLMPFSAVTALQRWGVAAYSLGLVLYGLALWLLIVFPDSNWSTSLFGFAAPAYAPLFWLLGIGLIGSRGDGVTLRTASWLYAASAIVFLISHNVHTLLIYARHTKPPII